MSNIVDTYEDEWANAVKGSSVSTTRVGSDPQLFDSW